MITQICWYLDVISIMSIDCPKCDEYFIPNILKTKMSKLLTENNNISLFGYPNKVNRHVLTWKYILYPIFRYVFFQFCSGKFRFMIRWPQSFECLDKKIILNKTLSKGVNEIKELEHFVDHM